ncbi:MULTISPECIES: threonine/serine exporter family protein [unclassified Luteimonas]|uniref:threonine/serine ThrE exporter family protein n=1 Tax=unclassified Luteimonas TaxID=2629088 RepID=UPI0018F0B541|nr:MULTISPECIES: threonine/serine exporter family protein [unclassified Luteimonas]MBJ6982384.1 threonine/serine exporter family protein [Luteimonas sp. MC1572]MBJ7575038.1 threonine/serine exporter family protein [Luteimonas sp. MC1828]QQO03647.1 threonine/serine exporter family protein [Luteimonas sp. MC1572]
MSRPFPQQAYAARIAFMVELAEHLHAYGTTSPRLEGALVQVAQRLGLECEPSANPTGMVLSFSDPMRPPGDSDTTRVIRMPPGETDLSRLCDVDRIAEEVLAGDIDVAAGHAALRALDRPAGKRGNALQVLGFSLAAAGVAGLLRLPWLEIALTAAIGLVIGMLHKAARTRPRLREAGDAVSAMVAAAITILVAAWVVPLNLNTVIISALIVLMPGLALTNAINELTSQHLMSGTARFAGAVATMIMLTVGTMIALGAADLVGIEPQVRAWRPQPDWVEWCALALASFAFAVLFRAKPRDYWLVMVSAVGAYLVSRLAGGAWGSEVGIFLAALLVTVAGNGYARWAKRPGAVVRVPGIILMVPGSSSVRTLMTSIQQQDLVAGQDAALAVVNILLAIVAGLIFGNLALPARRNL